MAICCCGHRTQKSRLCSLLSTLAIVVALHVFAFVVLFYASYQLRHCYDFGCMYPYMLRQISAVVIVACFVVEFIVLLSIAFPNYLCPVVPREEPPIVLPKSSDEVRAMYRPMAAWYRAPARDALRKHYGEFPPTSEALFAWASFDAVTTAFLVDQGVAARV